MWTNRKSLHIKELGSLCKRGLSWAWHRKPFIWLEYTLIMSAFKTQRPCLFCCGQVAMVTAGVNHHICCQKWWPCWGCFVSESKHFTTDNIVMNSHFLKGPLLFFKCPAWRRRRAHGPPINLSLTVWAAIWLAGRFEKLVLMFTESSPLPYLYTTLLLNY